MVEQAVGRRPGPVTWQIWSAESGAMGNVNSQLYNLATTQPSLFNQATGGNNGLYQVGTPSATVESGYRAGISECRLYRRSIAILVPDGRHPVPHPSSASPQAAGHPHHLDLQRHGGGSLLSTSSGPNWDQAPGRWPRPTGRATPSPGRRRVAGSYTITVWVKDVSSSSNAYDRWLHRQPYTSPAPVAITSFTPSKASPQTANTPITWTCTATGGATHWSTSSGSTGIGAWQMAQAYGTSNTFAWTPTRGRVLQHLRLGQGCLLSNTYDSYRSASTPSRLQLRWPSRPSPPSRRARRRWTLPSPGPAPPPGAHVPGVPVLDRAGIRRPGQMAQAYGTSNTFAWTPHRGRVLQHLPSGSRMPPRATPTTQTGLGLYTITATRSGGHHILHPQPGEPAGGEHSHHLDLHRHRGHHVPGVSVLDRTGIGAWSDGPGLRDEQHLRLDADAWPGLTASRLGQGCLLDDQHLRPGSRALYTITAAAPVAITSLTPSKASPQPVNTPITWTCTATGGATHLEYQFWVEQGSGGFQIAQAYGTSNTFDWTPTRGRVLHHQRLGQGRLLDDHHLRRHSRGSLHRNGRSSGGHPSLSPSKASPQPVNTSITWTCSATGGSTHLEYQFWVEQGSSGFQIAQAYGTSNTFNWTPTVAGSYTFSVWVKDASSTTTTCDATAGALYTVTAAAPVTIQSLSPSKASPQPVNTSITWTCSATGGSTHLEYQFWVEQGSSGFQIAQAYGTSNTFNWTPTVAGSYTFSVWVKDASSTTTTCDATAGALYTIQ